MARLDSDVPHPAPANASASASGIFASVIAAGRSHAARVATLGGVKVRTLSSLVLALPVILAVWFGSPWFEAMVVLCALVLAREWSRLCAGVVFAPACLVFVLGCAGVIALYALDQIAVAAVVGIVVVVTVFLAAERRGGWLAAGVAYIVAPGVALLYLRTTPVDGQIVVLWLLLVVWASDVGAYAIGRSIGGPRLAPRISPNKTWTGLVGGLGFSAATGVIAAILLTGGGETWWLSALAGLGLGAAAQAGDLAESACKRRFGVKDVGGLIPGHGGLLDRIDGLMTASVAAALIVVLAGGSMAPWL